ncbi:polysaccharide deacetylase family protein [Mycolicibacterium fluoranthenivorans]|uniref:Polysaccharide deacetylase n=1 Tax=Mycolicibacterium fluoranthenivorans TaxID=258505 RepID=A0A7X5ZGG3_9MYCO|nr:polysaccharide deacetylase [Mycolicibacterium fluoranthenivorans]MCV7356395.1 polysaccharide deacetylase [Mycolicibacterium fluoranthenivorans]NIH99221.1 hypothetical protein [Mycolicibacterium fluoranthenivorans]
MGEVMRVQGRWPGGAPLAVYVAVGVEDYRPDEGYAENLLPDIPAPDAVNRAWREYGNNVGVYRLLQRLGDLGIPATTLLNTMLYGTVPAVPDALRAAGAEFVGHGVSNSDSLHGLQENEELAYLTSVAQAIDNHEGAPPGGWSTPWLIHTPSTVDNLIRAGYRYLLDLRRDDQPEWLTSSAGALLSIPYALELNDSTSMIGRHVGAAEFADMIVDEFEELRESDEGRPIVMSIVLHSFISGAPFRLRHITRALDHIAAQRDSVWIAQPRQIYEAFARMCPPPAVRT